MSEARSIFDMLNELSNKNYELWNQLSEGEQKQFHPFVLLKWMTTSGVDPIRLQVINRGFFDHDRERQMRLLATVERKPTSRRWNWVKRERTDNTALIAAIREEYQLDNSTASSVLDLFSEDERVELLKMYDDNKSTGTKKVTRKKAR